VGALAQQGQRDSAHARQMSHQFDLLVSHGQEGDDEGGAETVSEEGECEVNWKPCICLFVAAHVHRQLCLAGQRLGRCLDPAVPGCCHHPLDPLLLLPAAHHFPPRSADFSEWPWPPS
jgi:hypothetical protein